MVDQRVAEQVVRFFEVTNGLVAMIFAGRLEKHPTLKVLAATAGGGLALAAGRMEAAFRVPSPPFLTKDDRLTKPPSELLGNVYVDTANLNVAHTMANIDLLGADHLLLGTDSPPSQMPAQFSLGHIENLAIEEVDRAAILGANAARLFRLDA
jgi:aminocarboxymuconate-semialdehyde decarboxylase